MMPSVVKSRQHTCSVLDAFAKNTPDAKGLWALSYQWLVAILLQ